jgi:cytochrome c peroxidase
MRALFTIALLFACAHAAHAQARFDEKTLARILQHSPVPPPPPDPTNKYADSSDAAMLGRAFFFEKRFSKDGRISCATCHDPGQCFADGLALARGLETNARHAPSLYNSAQQRWYFWDGRADSLWSQALQPLEGASEMGGNRAAIARVIASDAALRAGYEQVFGKLPENDATRVFVNVGKSLAAYERQLVSANSPFDRYAKALRDGDRDAQRAYPEAAARGLELFVGKANCRLCHSGPLFTDGEFHNVGVPSLDKRPPRDAARRQGIEQLLKDPFNAAGAYSDDARCARALELPHLVAGAEQWGQFRTPSLRNVARTTPYMHQGQFATLDDVLHFYSTREGAVPAGHHGEQVLQPLNLSPREIADLKAFLETLTDESLPDELRTPPAPRGRTEADGER